MAVSEEGLSPPIHPGWAGPSVGGLSSHCRARPVEVNGADALAVRAHTSGCAQGFDLSTDASILGHLFLVMWAAHG